MSASADEEDDKRRQEGGEYADEQTHTSDAPPHAIPDGVGGALFLRLRSMRNGHVFPSLDETPAIPALIGTA
jgi:hypothetical protein